MSNTKTPKIHVALHKPTTVTGLISMVQAIEAAMASASTTFPSPTPSMAQFTGDINALLAAEMRPRRVQRERCRPATRSLRSRTRI